MDCSLPGSSVHGIPKPEYWSGLPFPSPGDLPDPGTEPRSPALQADCLPSEPQGSPKIYAAAAAKSPQLCPTLCDSIDGSPPGSPIPGILQARTLEWVSISFSNAWKWKLGVGRFSARTLLLKVGLMDSEQGPGAALATSSSPTSISFLQAHCLPQWLRFSQLFPNWSPCP